MPFAPHVTDGALKQRESEDRLAQDIIDECRVQLMLKFRFLDLALWRMDVVPMRVGAWYPLATDAKQVVCDPPRVIARFQESFEESVRDYLHMVMHCIFRHPFDKDHDNLEAWGLTCDIIAENAALELCGARFASADDAARRKAVNEMRMLVGHLLPNKVYGLLKAMVLTPEGQQYRGLGRSVLNEWHALFERDDHGAWPANNRNAQSDTKTDSQEPEEVTEDDANPDVESDAIRTEMLGDTDSDPRNGGSVASESESLDDDAQQEQSGDDEDSDGDVDAADHEEPTDDDAARDEQEWEDISKQIEMNLETFSKDWGEEAGGLIANLAFVNRARYGYTDFLRRFMVTTEEMQVNMDEFDYIYYTYGMEHYGNMPLIEPLEYCETQRVHDFVIAIDTSESVSGDLVKRFLSHTFDILKSSQDYANEVNIHLIQCDAKVQSDTKITNLRDVDRMMEGMRVRGFGGTDFRPVFDYVDMLRLRGQLANLKGLVYFTDGFGQFPEKPPDYDAAFVFMDEEGIELPPVPPWAMKIVIDETGINRLRATV